MNAGIRQPTEITPVPMPHKLATSTASTDGGAEQRPTPAHHRQHRCRQRHHRTDLKIDAADDQHEGHADRHHHQRRDIVGQRRNRGERQEIFYQEIKRRANQAQVVLQAWPDMLRARDEVRDEEPEDELESVVMILSMLNAWSVCGSDSLRA